MHSLARVWPPRIRFQPRNATGNYGVRSGRAGVVQRRLNANAQVRPSARVARVEQLLQLVAIRVRLVHQPTFSLVLAAINIAPTTFLAIVATAAVAGTVAALATGRGVIVPVVVVELVLGVVLGPQVLGLHVDQFVAFFSDLGLGLLFFFAGYEIDLRRIRGRPLRLALLGWAMSLALAYTIGGVLAAAGIVLSLLYTGSALATTAIGTLIPILSDTGELRTRFGTYLLAAEAVGEFGPIMLLTLILSTQSTVPNALAGAARRRWSDLSRMPA